MVEEREAQKSSDRRESKLKFNPSKSSVEGKKLISFINNRQGQSEREGGREKRNRQGISS